MTKSKKKSAKNEAKSKKKTKIGPYIPAFVILPIVIFIGIFILYLTSIADVGSRLIQKDSDKIAWYITGSLFILIGVIGIYIVYRMTRSP